jgi:hypothetical protein
LKKFWELKLAEREEIEEMEIARAIQGVDVQKILEGIEEEEMQALQQMDVYRGLKLTRSCSF